MAEPSSSLQVTGPSQSDAQSFKSSEAEVWYLKEIIFGEGENRQRRRIITQNFNGPCSFIAICNILILRGDIEIEPYDRPTVSYEHLSQLVGEYLLTSCPDIDISAALSVMPTTTKGMDLNPLFTAPTAFRPAGESGELMLFERTGIKLVHGWLVDPHSREAEAVFRVQDYDTAVTLIADADHITHGKLLAGDSFDVDANQAGPSNAAGSSSQAGLSNAGTSSHGDIYYHSGSYSDEQRLKIEDAIVLQTFLESTKSQLTYHGLFELISLVAPGQLVALFRNSHLSVLYKPKPGVDTAEDDHSIYSLVTDYVFLNEPSVVWERFEDVDGGSSAFVDFNFKNSQPLGGDFAGQTTEGALRQWELETGQFAAVDPADHALAQQLQAEEDAAAQQAAEQRQLQAVLRRDREEADKKRKADQEAKKAKKAKDKCIIM